MHRIQVGAAILSLLAAFMTPFGVKDVKPGNEHPPEISETEDAQVDQKAKTYQSSYIDPVEQKVLKLEGDLVALASRVDTLEGVHRKSADTTTSSSNGVQSVTTVVKSDADKAKERQATKAAISGMSTKELAEVITEAGFTGIVCKPVAQQSGGSSGSAPVANYGSNGSSAAPANYYYPQPSQGSYYSPQSTQTRSVVRYGLFGRPIYGQTCVKNADGSETCY